MISSFAAARTLAIDFAERAAKTFVQAAVAVTVPVLVASDATTRLSLNWWEQLGVVAGTAGLAAVGSLVTSTLSGVRTGTGSLSSKVAQTAVTPGAHASDSGPLLSGSISSLATSQLAELARANTAQADTHPTADPVDTALAAAEASAPMAVFTPVPATQES